MEMLLWAISVLIVLIILFLRLTCIQDVNIVTGYGRFPVIRNFNLESMRLIHKKFDQYLLVTCNYGCCSLLKLDKLREFICTCLGIDDISIVYPCDFSTEFLKCTDLFELNVELRKFLEREDKVEIKASIVNFVFMFRVLCDNEQLFLDGEESYH